MLLPLGRRRTRRDRTVAASYLAGTLSGALITALSAWVLSGFTEPLGPRMRWAAILVIAAVAWLAKHGPLEGRLPLPENKRQIPTAVFARSLIRGAYRFGLEMGTGMRTYVPAFAPYVLLGTLLFARPTLLEALAVALGFGFGRAVPLMLHLGPEHRDLMTTNFLRGAGYRFAHLAAGVVVLIGGLRLV